MCRKAFVTILFFGLYLSCFAQDPQALLARVKAKLDAVKDYTASGNLKTDISFMKVPESAVDFFYKKPDKYKIRKKDGISIFPKGAAGMNMNSFFASTEFTAVPSGRGRVDNQDVAVIKLLPNDDKNPIVVSTLYIDEKNAVIRKAVTTTKDNGTYEMEMSYGKYINWALPDKLVFTFNAQEYKLPKGIAFDYDAGQKSAPAKSSSNQKAKIEVVYREYIVNRGVADDVFK